MGHIKNVNSSPKLRQTPSRRAHKSIEQQKLIVQMQRRLRRGKKRKSSSPPTLRQQKTGSAEATSKLRSGAQTPGKQQEATLGKWKFLRAGFENSTLPLHVISTVLRCSSHKKESAKILKCMYSSTVDIFSAKVDSFATVKEIEVAVAQCLLDLNTVDLTPRQIFFTLYLCLRKLKVPSVAADSRKVVNFYNKCFGRQSKARLPLFRRLLKNYAKVSASSAITKNIIRCITASGTIRKFLALAGNMDTVKMCRKAMISSSVNKFVLRMEDAVDVDGYTISAFSGGPGKSSSSLVKKAEENERRAR